jgi:hypothetical protein
MADPPLDLYDVIGINADGSRVVVEDALSRQDAEQCRQLLLQGSAFIGIEIERVPGFDLPQGLLRLVGISDSGKRIIICEGVSSETVEKERIKLLDTGMFARLIVEPAKSIAKDPFDTRD